MDPLKLYIQCSRLVFSVEKCEVWNDYDDFKTNFISLFENLCCISCTKLIRDPCSPKRKNLTSCHHRVCLECIGKKRPSQISSCKMCTDYTLFEKDQSIKLVLICLKDLCEYIKQSWIYDYIQKQPQSDSVDCVNSELLVNILQMIEMGANYGKTSEIKKELINIVVNKQSVSVPYSSQTFPCISPLSPVSPIISNVQSPTPEVCHIAEITPVIPLKTSINLIPQTPIVSTPQTVTVTLPQLFQFHQQPTITSIPGPSKITHLPINANNTSAIVKTSPNIIKYQSPPIKMTAISQSPTSITTKNTIAPLKIQYSSALTSPTVVSQPQIYSVMYTGSGNKITLKRKPPEEGSPSHSNEQHSNPIVVKTEPTNTNNNPIINASFKRPPSIQSPQQNTTTTDPSKQQQKRRGCRCGNATAAPGKLTCCGQRCPCYVDSKACIDCKCRGCRNPHYVDGLKKMRHHVPDIQQQQIQQQNFLASLQHQQQQQQQQPVMKELQLKPQLQSHMQSDDGSYSLLDNTTTMSTMSTMMMATKSSNINSINNCIISVNSNGQYQIKQQTNNPRIVMKEPVKTMSSLLFPTTTSMHHQQAPSIAGGLSTMAGLTKVPTSSIQIVGLYSQLPMNTGDNQKIIIKNEQTQTMSSNLIFDKQQLTMSQAQFTTGNNLNLNSFENFLASLQHQQQQQQQPVMKELQLKPQLQSHMQSDDGSYSLLDNTTTMSTMSTMMMATKSSNINSINNCIISVNSNGQYQIKQQTNNPRIVMKEPVKTMSSLLFPTTTSMHHQQAPSIAGGLSTMAGLTKVPTSSIQIVGLYSQLPMNTGDNQKIIIKNEQTQTMSSNLIFDKQQLTMSQAQFTTGNNLNLNSNLI